MFKIVGLGGAGINAVEYMMSKDALDATFMVCDTERKRLEDSPVPQKLLLKSEGLGMGGGTGSGAAIITPVLAQRKGIFTVGIVTLPFHFEGKGCRTKALNAVATMKLVANEVYVIDNEEMAKTYSDLTMTNAFKAIDEALSEKTGKIINAIAAHVKNISFNDMEDFLKDI